MADQLLDTMPVAVTVDHDARDPAAVAAPCAAPIAAMGAATVTDVAAVTPMHLGKRTGLMAAIMVPIGPVMVGQTKQVANDAADQTMGIAVAMFGLDGSIATGDAVMIAFAGYGRRRQ
jgi:hypothetical protein